MELMDNIYGYDEFCGLTNFIRICKDYVACMQKRNVLPYLNISIVTFYK